MSYSRNLRNSPSRLGLHYLTAYGDRCRTLKVDSIDLVFQRLTLRFSLRSLERVDIVQTVEIVEVKTSQVTRSLMSNFLLHVTFEVFEQVDLFTSFSPKSVDLFKLLLD